MAFSNRSVSIVFILTVTAIIGYLICQIPVQVSDSVGNLLQVQQESLWHLFIGQFANGAYLRPLLWAQIKLGYDLASGQELLAFKAIHVVQLLLLAALFIRLLHVRTSADLVAAVLATLVLFGIHTFDGMVREAFPINAFLTIAICVLAAANLTIGEHRWWRDVAALALFSFAVLTVESGALVTVAVVAGRLVGLRGVSWRGAAGTIGAFAVYLALRGVLQIGVPGLEERASGFGFDMYEPRQLVARFGNNPLPFYGYNVFSQFVSVLLSEPRGGVWWASRGLAAGNSLPSWLSINILSSLIATVMVCSACARSFGRWRAGALDMRDRIMLMSLAVLVANACGSFGYSKDVIMSTGGVFFALMAYVGTSRLLADAHGAFARRLVYVTVALLLAMWSVRTVALAYRLRMQVTRVQAEWTDVDAWFERQGIPIDSPEASALVSRMRRRALRGSSPAVEWTGWNRVLDLN